MAAVPVPGKAADSNVTATAAAIGHQQRSPPADNARARSAPTWDTSGLKNGRSRISSVRPRPATARPVVTRRHATLDTAPCATGRGCRRDTARSAENCHSMWRGLLPSNRRDDYPGGGQVPSRARLRRVAFAMAQAPPLTGPGRKYPGPHGTCRVKARSGRSPSAPNRKNGPQVTQPHASYPFPDP